MRSSMTEMREFTVRVSRTFAADADRGDWDDWDADAIRSCILNQDIRWDGAPDEIEVS